MKTKFSEIVFLNPDTFLATKRITAIIDVENTMNYSIEDFLLEMETFLRRDKTKDFPIDEVKETFKNTVNGINDYQITLTDKLTADLTTLKLTTIFEMGQNIQEFVDGVCKELSEMALKNGRKVEVYELGFTPQIADLENNQMIVGSYVRVRFL